MVFAVMESRTNRFNGKSLHKIDNDEYCIIIAELTYYDWRPSALSKLILPIDSGLVEKGLKMDLVQ